MVHLNTFAPTPKAVTVEVGELGEVIVPFPLTNVQVPVPAPDELAANVALVPQTVWVEPAFDITVAGLTVIFTESSELPLAQVA